MAVVSKHKPPSLPKPTSQPLNAEPNSKLSKSKEKKVAARPVAFKHDVDCTSDISEEEEYVPQMSDKESDGYDDDGIDFEENPEDLIMENFMDGNWEPFWQTEDAYEDAGGYLSRVYKNGEIYDDADLGKIKLKPWQLFVDKDHLKEVLRDYCLQEGFALVVQKGDNGRYTAECVDTSKLLEDIRASPDIKGKAMNALLDQRFGVTMATSTLYKMKAKALQIIQGGHDQSYSNLIGYCQLLKEKNTGTVAFCTWKQLEEPETPLQFKSIFISFSAQFKGLINGCRGLVGVDDSHLKGNYGGSLLSAIGLDGNNEYSLLLLLVVDSENKNSWSFFSPPQDHPH
ncbi:Sialidase [Bienertia sinuspersici]